MTVTNIPKPIDATYVLSALFPDLSVRRSQRSTVQGVGRVGGHPPAVPQTQSRGPDALGSRGRLRPAPRRLRAVLRTLAGAVGSRGLGGWLISRRRSEELEEGKFCSRAGWGGARERRCFRLAAGRSSGFRRWLPGAVERHVGGPCSRPFSGGARVT